jgi:glycosyltransferase involved in cell wall biosynthesis
MRGVVNVALEEVFVRDLSGRLFSPAGFGDAFWSRYLVAFDRVIIVARVRPGEGEFGMSEVTLPAVDLHPVPVYQGAVGYLRARAAVNRALTAAAARPGAHIVRLPGILGGGIARKRIHGGQPFAVELVGDPADVFSGGGVGGRLAPLYRALFVSATRRACAKAAATAYVTRGTLQCSYPPTPGRFTTHFSSVALGADDFCAPLKRVIREDGPFTLFAAGSMEQLYKGFDVLIRSLRLVERSGLPVSLRIAGVGRRRAELEALAAGTTVTFVGRLSRDQVFEEMRACDLFVMPSRTEGLPRALIEAMAQAAPAVASLVGGIPELLDEADLVPPDDIDSLARRIETVLSDPDRRRRMSARNFEVAREYQAPALEARRRTFYEVVRATAGPER